MQISKFISNRIVFSSQRAFTKVLVWIAISSVALSLAVMIVSMAVIVGFNESISNKVFGFWGHIHITDLQVSRSYEPVPVERNQSLIDEIYDVSQSDWDPESSNTEPSVKHIQSFAFLPTIVNSKEELEGLVLKGIGHDYDKSIIDQYIKQGKIPSVTSDSLGREIMLSVQTANRVQVNVGDPVVLIFVNGDKQTKRRFTVSGLYRTGLEEYDIKFAIVDIRNVQALLGWTENQIAGYELYTDDTEYLPQIADHIYENTIPNDLYVETIQEKFPSIFDWLALQRINEQIIIALMLLVCIINMATIILIVILERSRMIGLLKSLGATNASIRGIFLRYALWILVAGIVIGNIVGLAFCWIQKHYPFIHLDEENYYVSVAPIAVKWWHVLSINGIAIVIVLICMWLPTLVASRISPVKVLKFN